MKSFPIKHIIGFSVYSIFLFNHTKVFACPYKKDAVTIKIAKTLESKKSEASDSTVTIRIDSTHTVTLPISYILKYGECEERERGENTKCTRDTLTRYERHRQLSLKRWEKIIPNQVTIQYAGSIGLISAGIGWHYGRGNHWESEFLVGILPKYKSDEISTTFTLKERYIPWHCQVHRRWTIEPFTTGIFFNFIGGENFWSRQPSRYPKNYYGFSTKVRTNIFIGQRIRFNIPRNRRLLHQAISAYYEISTCDLYLVSKLTNKDFPWKETLSLAFGLRWEM